MEPKDCPAKWPWVERRFDFGYPPGKFPDLLERVWGTPARIEETVRGLDREALTHHDGRGWSAQQNIGHLLDTEYLLLTRVEQILSGEPVLVAADMENRRTHEAGHDARDIRELLSMFRAERGRAVARLEALCEADWGKASFHRRLGQAMRVVDVVCMVAEHDDYHLARVRQLIRGCQRAAPEAGASAAARGSPGGQE